MDLQASQLRPFKTHKFVLLISHLDCTPEHAARPRKEMEPQADSCDTKVLPSRKEEQAAKILQLKEQLQSSGQADSAGAQLVQGGELQHASDIVSDAYLHRWLRARSWDVQKACSDIVKHAEWRVSFMPNGRIDEATVANEIACEKLYLQGIDRQGRPLMIALARKHNGWTRSLEELERMCCYVLDEMAKMAAPHVDRNPRGQCCTLLDLTDMAMVSMDVQAIKTLLTLLGEHYVERLGALIFWNPPLIFWGVWNSLSPLLPEVTRAKIFVIDPSKTASLVELVGAEVLPTEYGGCAELAAPLGKQG
ncbi:CRAL-TRIO domain-containing protein [Haematococcus lacustris]